VFDDTLQQNYEILPTNGIISQIGNTPLLQLNSIPASEGINIPIYAKAEYFNPGGSVKDRAAWNMIKKGILTGELTVDKTIIDASSGNTGIALAMIGSSLGYKVKLCIPKNASSERLSLLNAYGAEVILTDPLEGTDGAITKVRDLVDEEPEIYFYTDQYNNPANWQAHYETTGIEILNQTERRLTHFISGLGTSGTFGGVSRRIKEEKPEIKTISIQPDSPFHGLEGLKHMETAITPGIYDPDLADQSLTISTDHAQQITKRLAREEGILVGISSGANVAAALEIARELDEGMMVTILCDRGERYLSDMFWMDK
jgi:cysteine synthase B